MRPGAHHRRRRGDTDPRRPGRRLQPRVHLPQGNHARSPARRPRPPARAAGPPRRRPARGHLGGGVRRGRTPAAADHPAARPRRGRRVPRQPDRPQPLGHALQPPAAARARHAQRLHRQHRRSAAKGDLQRADVRDDAQPPRPRPRPHLLPPAAGRQPTRVQRQPGDRARLAGAAASYPRAGRGGRGGRPQAHPHGRACLRARPDPPRRRRAPPHGHGAHPVRRAAG